MLQPSTLSEAVKALAGRGAVAMAGATDLIPAMRKGEIRPRVLVNLKGIAEMTGVRRTRQGTRIGALTRVADLLDDPIVAQDLPLLADVAAGFASPQIRNLATIGGNLCNAAPSADLALPLLVVDATAEVRGKGGRRKIAMSEFFRGVNRTALRPGEILTAIVVPRPRRRTGMAHAKLGVRKAMDLAFVGVAATIQISPDGKKCRRARVALGSVAPTPRRAAKAEAILEGQLVTSQLIDEAAEGAASESRPVTDLRASREYRREMTRVLTRRALREAFRRAGKEQP
jgi:carbon-monoxide dehydrogenase medium subunit